MFDTIYIYKRTDELLKKDSLCKLKESVDPLTGEITVKGMLGNLTVQKFPKAISIIGSLVKYATDSNFIPLSRQWTKAAIRKLEADLKISLDNAYVTGLDITNNIKLNQPTQNYLQCFGNYGNSHTYDIDFRTQLVFRSTKISLSFYDKLKEMKKHESKVYLENYGPNLLRYECQLRAKPSVFFDVNKIKVKMLYERWFCNLAIHIWRDEFKKIKKYYGIEPEIVINNKTTAYDIEKHLLQVGLAKVGYSNIIGQIKGLTNHKPGLKDKKIFANKKRYIKNKIEKLYNNPNNLKTTQSDLMHELEEKIDLVCEKYLEYSQYD